MLQLVSYADTRLARADDECRHIAGFLLRVANDCMVGNERLVSNKTADVVSFSSY
jgi:hypothetical protein